MKKLLVIDTGSPDDSPKATSDYIQDRENPFDLSKTAERSNKKQELKPEINKFDQNFGMAMEKVKSNKGSVEAKKFVPKSKRSEMS
jgi:hypothetical protein